MIFGFYPSGSTTYEFPGDYVRSTPGLEWDLVLHPGNPVAISATKPRADLYRLIDNVITSGVPVEVELRGKKVRIVPAEPRDKLANLVKRPGLIVGGGGRLDSARTFDAAKWRRKWAMPLK